MSKGFMAILAVVVVVLVGIFMLTREPEEPRESVENPLEITEQDHTIGPADAPVTLVKYSDFQCPSCANAAPQVKDVIEEFGDDVQVVYRHFHVVDPTTISFDASRASEAAANQDAFWEMHDLLFERQQEWAQDPSARDLFHEYAAELELDEEQFAADFESAGSRVDRDLDISEQLGLLSTPTFYINDEPVEDMQSIEEINERVAAALADAQSDEE